jgi:hypothetical protein
VEPEKNGSTSTTNDNSSASGLRLQLEHVSAALQRSHLMYDKQGGNGVLVSF